MKTVFSQLFAISFLVASTGAFLGCNGASDEALKQLGAGPTGFMHKTLVRGGHSHVYGLFVPYSFRADIPINNQLGYPVIVFLHGVGEGGTDARANMRVGLAKCVAENARSFNFICIFPQSASGGWDENSDDAINVLACLDDVIRHYPVDQDRVSLTGLSTGGYGTWAIGAKYKDRFAALVPMGSSASAEKYATQLVDMPIWAFHNSGDMFAAPWNDSTTCAEIKTLGNHNAKYTEYPASGHDCWETAYGDGELFSWLLRQRRRHAPGMETFGNPQAAPAVSHAAPAPRAGISLDEPTPVRANTSAVISSPY